MPQVFAIRIMQADHAGLPGFDHRLAAGCSDRVAMRRAGHAARVQGFTLIEALMAMLVSSVLVGIALPAWSGASEAAHSAAAKGALLESYLGAVGHAALTGSEVVLCPGDNSGCRTSSDWSRGWIAYADLDGDRIRDDNETLLKRVEPLAGKVHLRSTAGRTRLVFQPNGGNAGSNVTFTLCDGRGVSKATTLVLANDGRLRAGKPKVSAAQACVQGA